MRRFKEHKGRGRGAKYTASRRPLRFEAAFESENRSAASKLEYQLKALSKDEKEGLILGRTPEKLDLSSYRKVPITYKGEIKMLFICYPKCSTCKKAESYLKENAISYEFRDIKTENPTRAELKSWHEKSGLPLKRFFNTSGVQYRTLELAKKLPEIDEDEQINLLATDGMLVRRPILVGDDFVLVGFKQDKWEEKLSR